MRAHALFSGALLLALSACSDDGSSTPGGAPDAGSDVAADVPQEAGPCEPLGTWSWTFQTEAGTPATDDVLIEATPDAGPSGVTVTFLDRQVPEDTCTPPPDGGTDAGPEPIVAQGTLDPATCTLKVGYSATWCHSGEQQCESWDISLALAGDSGSGTAKRVGGWCMDTQETSYLVTVAKK